MKLQVAFDLIDIDKALSIAQSVEPYVDILEIGTLLIYKYGDDVVKKFKEKFNQKLILADAKIVDQSKDAISLFAKAGADWITILAGAQRTFIHNACSVAHEYGKKIMLDLVDSHSLGQSALEAKSLGVDALLFHRPSTEDTQLTFSEKWEMVKGNTELPIFIASNISRTNIGDVLSIGASGIVIGKAIVLAENPAEEAKYFSSVVNHHMI